MNSSCNRRTKKIAERMVEIEEEVKIFHNHSGEIIKNCTALVKKMREVPDGEDFLDEYTTTYRYLSSCAASFSEFNCKMETLRLGSKVTPPFLQVSFPVKNDSVKTTENMENRKSFSHESERTHFATSESGDHRNVPLVAKSEEQQNPLEAHRHSEATSVKKKGSQSFEHAQQIKLCNSECEPNEVASKCSLENKNPPEQSSKRNNNRAIRSTLPLPTDPGSISKSRGCDGPEEEQRTRESSVQRGHGHVNDDLLECVENEIGKESGFTKKVGKATEKKCGKWEKNSGKELRPLKMDGGLGVIHDVILSHLVSPDEFYVFVKCEELRLLEELKTKLSKLTKSVKGGAKACRELCTNQPETKTLAAKMLGSHALAFSDETSSWTRIKILDWRTEEADDHILVFYVDHGASDLLSFRRIAPLPESLAEYPAFVQKCYMSCIMPLREKWSEEDKTVFEIFTESTDKKSHLKMEITEMGVREDGAIGVKLFLPESGICLNDKLTEYGIAKPKPDEMSDGREEKSEDTGGRYLPPYAPGETVPVKVTCILKVNHIFCVKDYDKTQETDVLQTLISHLNNPKEEKEMSRLDKTPDVGDLVIGKYEDGLWYRAQVVKSNPEFGVCKVIFLDYGNTETVSFKEMRKMESKYLEIPFQMVECLLEGVKIKSKADQHEAVKYLNEKISEETTINIKKVLDGVRSFYSVAILDKKGQNIADDLVSAGFAERP